MITFLAGTVRDIAPNFITLECQGVGFGVNVTCSESFTINTQTALEIILYWNAEQGPQLFGFTNKSEKLIFNLVTSCAGCGPKLALSVLAQLSPADFLSAISRSDIISLSSVNGIGRKKADQMVLQLKDKVDTLILANTPVLPVSSSLLLSHLKQLSDALNSLGYSRPEIQLALDHIKKQDNIDKTSFDQVLRKALGFLAKKQ